jgi:hypothetical protein
MFRVLNTVLVNHKTDISPEATDRPSSDFWVAKIIEIRARKNNGQEPTVFVKVNWFYWPEELPGGRMPWHGKNELVLSNHSAVLGARCISELVSVQEYSEKTKQYGTLRTLWWRTTYDCMTKRSSVSHPSLVYLVLRAHVG